MRIRKRITTFEFLSEVYSNMEKDPNLTILHVLPYSYSHTLMTNVTLEQIMIVYKDES